MAAILDEISAQHQGLLELTQHGTQEEAPVTQAQEFLLRLAAAGAEVADTRERSWLRGLIRFWGSFVYDHIGQFPGDGSFADIDRLTLLGTLRI